MESVLITGTSRGLGKSLLDEFWKQGYHVYPLVRNKNDKELIEEKYSIRCYPILSDITQEECIQEIKEVVQANTGVIDILINNAGIPGEEYEIEKVTQSEVMEVFKVHCIGAINVSKGSIPFLKDSKRGRIINISSRLGSLTKMSSGEFINRKFSYSYKIAKASQNMLSICLNNELKEYNIGVIAVHPGLIKTSSGSTDANETPEEAALRIFKWIRNIKGTEYGTYQYPGSGEFPW